MRLHEPRTSHITVPYLVSCSYFKSYLQTVNNASNMQLTKRFKNVFLRTLPVKANLRSQETKKVIFILVWTGKRSHLEPPAPFPRTEMTDYFLTEYVSKPFGVFLPRIVTSNFARFVMSLFFERGKKSARTSVLPLKISRERFPSEILH